MPPTIPISSDIVNGVAGVLMMICILPVLEQVRVLAVNRADKLDLARTGFIHVGSRMQLLGKTTKRHGSLVLVLLAAIVVLCSLVGELMFPFSIKGTSKSREKVVTAVGSKLVDWATLRRGFNTTWPCFDLTYTATGGEGVLFNRSFLLDGKRQCDQQPYFNFSFALNRPAGEVAELVSIVQEMRTFTIGKQSTSLVPFEDGSLAACIELLSTGLRSRSCTVMRPLANGTYQFWIYETLSASVANLTGSRTGWATERKLISRLAVERNWAPLISLVREIMSKVPIVVDVEANATTTALDLTNFALTMITFVSTDVREKKLNSMGMVVRAFFTDGPGNFTAVITQDVTELNQTLLGLSLGLAILPSLIFLLIGHLKKSEGNSRIDSGCPKFLAALAVSPEGIMKLDNSSEMPGNVLITIAEGNVRLELLDGLGCRKGD
jgi:hypothetical protein